MKNYKLVRILTIAGNPKDSSHRSEKRAMKRLRQWLKKRAK